MIYVVWLTALDSVSLCFFDKLQLIIAQFDLVEISMILFDIIL